MFQEISQFRLAQADGGWPTVIAAGSAPGDSGVFVSKGAVPRRLACQRRHRDGTTSAFD